MNDPLTYAEALDLARGDRVFTLPLGARATVQSVLPITGTPVVAVTVRFDEDDRRFTGRASDAFAHTSLCRDTGREGGAPAGADTPIPAPPRPESPASPPPPVLVVSVAGGLVQSVYGENLPENFHVLVADFDGDGRVPVAVNEFHPYPLSQMPGEELPPDDPMYDCYEDDREAYRQVRALLEDKADA
jgi:hypothetical protein